MKHNFKPDRFYDKYRVAIEIRHEIHGGTPRDPKLIETWIKARTGYNDEITKAQTKEALEVMTEQAAQSMWTGFPSDDKGIFVWSRQVKAMLREAATMLRITTSKIGSKQIFQHGLEVRSLEKGKKAEQRIYFEHRNKVAKKLAAAHGSNERPIHVMTAKGPRTSLKREDRVDAGAVLHFEIWVLKTKRAEKRHVGEKDLVDMLTFSQENGLGASRSQGFGKFDVIEFKRLSCD